MYNELSDAQYQNREAANDVAHAHAIYTTPCCGTKPEFEEVQTAFGYDIRVICECEADVTEDYAATVY
jgi:hypothetical protein